MDSGLDYISVSKKQFALASIYMLTFPTLNNWNFTNVSSMYRSLFVPRQGSSPNFFACILYLNKENYPPTLMRLYDFKAHDLLRGICTQVPRVSQLPTSLQISFRSLLLLVPSAMNGRAPTLLFILSYIFRFHRLNTFRAYPTRKSSMFFKASSMCSPTTDI